MIKKIFLINLLVIFVAYVEVYGGWTGPLDVLSTTFGNGNGQVGLQQGDTGDEFPWRMAVSPTGRIALCDEANDRVVIFKSDGTFEKNIDILSTGVVFDSSDSLYLKAKFRKFNKDGTEAFVKDVGYHETFATDGNIIGYDKDKKTYTLYYPTGQLIKTMTTRPLELGWMQSSKNPSGGHRYSIKYPDRTYGFVIPWEYVKTYSRDSAGNINIVAQTETKEEVYKINSCGRVLGTLLMPNDKKHVVAEIGPETIEELEIQYGSPVIVHNGDIYCWARTPDNYSILKWTWVDDPNVPAGPDAPTNLSVIPSTSGLYLTWTLSLNDPGCVTGYEIARATSAGGVFSTVGTVEKGVVKYNDTSAAAGTTYYYKVRAAAGTEYSIYTAEASGKR